MVRAEPWLAVCAKASATFALLSALSLAIGASLQVPQAPWAAGSERDDEVRYQSR